jgi:hypothetical protein
MIVAPPAQVAPFSPPVTPMQPEPRLVPEPTIDPLPRQLVETAVTSARPADWPVAEGFAGAPPDGFPAPDCRGDARGNWLCWIGGGSPGPCAFTPQGDVVAAKQVLWSNLDASAVVTRLSAADGAPSWTRVWNRTGGFPTHTIAALAVAVHEDGRITWAGRDCFQDEQAPPADDPGYYQGSCINGHVATLDAQGALLWELRAGARDGIDLISDLVLARDGGVYVGGLFQAPLALAGLDPLAATGGVDLFALAIDADGRPRWARAFGSPEHEADGVRLAESDDGELAVRGNFTQAPTDGFAALLDADGALRWQTDVPVATYGHAVFVNGELLIAAQDELMVVDPSGRLSSRSLPGATRAARIVVTDAGTIALFTPGAGLIEATPEGTVLRRLALGERASPWYEGGLCAGPGGAIAVLGSGGLASDFGFLDEAVEAAGVFVLHLAEWQDR